MLGWPIIWCDRLKRIEYAFMMHPHPLPDIGAHSGLARNVAHGMPNQSIPGSGARDIPRTKHLGCEVLCAQDLADLVHRGLFRQTKADPPHESGNLVRRGRPWKSVVRIGKHESVVELFDPPLSAGKANDFLLGSIAGDWTPVRVSALVAESQRLDLRHKCARDRASEMPAFRQRLQVSGARRNHLAWLWEEISDSRLSGMPFLAHEFLNDTPVLVRTPPCPRAGSARREKPAAKGSHDQARGLPACGQKFPAQQILTFW